MKDVAKTVCIAVSAIYLVFTVSDVRLQAEEAEETPVIHESITPQDNTQGAVESTPEQETAEGSDHPHTRAEEIYCYLFCDKDRELLKNIAMAEAGGEDTVGKALVIRTVINRIYSDDFPQDIEEIITQKSQFSSVTDDGRFYEVDASEDCELALNMVEHGWDESQGALYFESCTEECWQSRNREFLFKHGGHSFYR